MITQSLCSHHRHSTMRSLLRNQGTVDSISLTKPSTTPFMTCDVIAILTCSCTVRIPFADDDLARSYINRFTTVINRKEVSQN